MKTTYLYVLVAALLLLDNATGQVVDMGECSCACGQPRGGSRPSGSYLNNIIGPKGRPGRPGKHGPVGARGRQGLRGEPGPPGISAGLDGSGHADSCHNYLGSGVTQSGILKIKPSATSAAIDVYCDMETAGGGWTLVASIHENNIKGKCTLGDNWSSDQGSNSRSYNGSRNWENYNVFGSAESATSEDYKSPAYFNVLASDVMIWHVPNDIDSTQWRNQAFLKYYTSNGFLKRYGGTLQSLFVKYFPLKFTPPPPGHESFRGIQSVMGALNSSATQIRGAISNFNRYTYDYSGVRNYISDGGRDMFDGGNKVYYRIGNAPFRQIVYTQTYRDTINQIEVSSTTVHPFMMLMWIGNTARTVTTLDLKVISNTGADGGGHYSTYTGQITYQNFLLQYKSYNVYDANDPTLSEVFFCISNTIDWNSVPPSSFVATSWPSGTDSLTNTMRVNGSPKSILMGYTLLSRTTDSRIAESQLREALTRIVQTIARFGQIEAYNCSRANESLVVPVNYVGDTSNETVLSHVPPNAREQVVPGFIQFRSLDPKGIPNAICPGVKTDFCRPATVCVGGINSIRHNDAPGCGDFAAWDGLPSDNPTDTEPSGSAHSNNDIQSSLLIFTRGG